MRKPAEFRIRNATMQDAERLAEIYGYYVEHTAVSFEYRAPSAAEFCIRMQKIKRNYPYLVAEYDGQVAGFAYATALNTRKAYDRSCEMTVYVDASLRRCGLGRLLYEELEDALKKQGICNCYACIAYPTQEDAYLTMDSVAFHTRLGYRQAGRFSRCGYKFGHWYDVVWMEKIIREHEAFTENHA